MAMEWYYGRANEDVTVPKDGGMFEGLPSSPESWPSWVNIVGNCSSQKKLNALEVEDLFNEPMLSRQQRSDVHLNDLPKIEEADDIFFDSLFKVDAGESEGSESSANIAQTSSWNDVMAYDFSNHVRDSTNDVSSVGHFSHEQELEAEMCMLEEQSDMCEDTNEYISMDEPVLLELQNLTQQLADTTRVCFRDSLYRLAENSRHQMKCSQSGQDDTRDGPSRLQESKTEDSDTNSIDRTVATLLFTTMQFCNSTSDPDGDTLGREYQANSYWYHPCSSAPGGDAEVPTFD
ncbi:protein LNK3-like [Salvia miltiorrhiza]|uniref:protein LNK3-like n=1 Tax=Salvia miltiorrhiza TaxID=226208 RepID=UPI0025AD4645|nr:protein LNK3-like [Salvia miltiorrhiza]